MMVFLRLLAALIATEIVAILIATVYWVNVYPLGTWAHCLFVVNCIFAFLLGWCILIFLCIGLYQFAWRGR
jgi:hypothetical protein